MRLPPPPPTAKEPVDSAVAQDRESGRWTRRFTVAVGIVLAAAAVTVWMGGREVSRIRDVESSPPRWWEPQHRHQTGMSNPRLDDGQSALAPPMPLLSAKQGGHDQGRADHSNASPSGARGGKAAPPRLRPTGQNVASVVESFVLYQQWMLENPGSSAVDMVYHPQSEKGRKLKAALASLVERGQRFDCATTPEVSIIDEAAASQDLIRIVIHVRQGPCRLLDASGTEVGQQPGFRRRAFEYTLERTAKGWYIINDENLGDVE